MIKGEEILRIREGVPDTDKQDIKIEYGVNILLKASEVGEYNRKAERIKKAIFKEGEEFYITLQFIVE